MRAGMFPFAILLALSAGPAAAMDLTGADVQDGATMPKSHICSRLGGGDTSPQLAWSGAPANTKTFALTMFDPDAHGGAGFWHWVVLDIPASVTGIPENAGVGQASLPAGARAAKNGAGTDAYLGSCPPDAIVHHYQITVWALPSGASPDPTASPAVNGAYLEKHAIARARLTPVYRKQP